MKLGGSRLRRIFEVSPSGPVTHPVLLREFQHGAERMDWLRSGGAFVWFVLACIASVAISGDALNRVGPLATVWILIVLPGITTGMGVVRLSNRIAWARRDHLSDQWRTIPGMPEPTYFWFTNAILTPYALGHLGVSLAHAAAFASPFLVLSIIRSDSLPLSLILSPCLAVICVSVLAALGAMVQQIAINFLISAVYGAWHDSKLLTSHLGDKQRIDPAWEDCWERPLWVDRFSLSGARRSTRQIMGGLLRLLQWCGGIFLGALLFVMVAAGLAVTLAILASPLLWHRWGTTQSALIPVGLAALVYLPLLAVAATDAGRTVASAFGARLVRHIARRAEIVNRLLWWPSTKE